MCVSEIKRYSRSFIFFFFKKMWLWIHQSERLTGCVSAVTPASLTCKSFNKTPWEKGQHTLASVSSVFFFCLFVLFLASWTGQQLGIFTGSRTCAGCAPVAGQHAGKRLSAPWGRPASCPWSPPPAADGSGSSLPGGQSRPSGSVS